jgi:uncharacterized membrane-anchored protein YhcB (DUF1043 family)
MKKLLWFIAGIAIGAVAAKQVEQNPQAKKAYDEAKLSMQEFRDAVLDGFQERESELIKPKPRSASKPTATKKTGPKSKPSSK